MFIISIALFALAFKKDDSAKAQDSKISGGKKMKNLIKKSALLALAALVVICTGTVVHADGEATLTNGVVGTNAGTVQSGVLKLEKGLIVYNPSETTVAAPKITYTYTLTAGSADKDIYDADGVNAKTLAGILPATTTATVVYNNEDITAAAAGQENIKNFTFDFSGVTYPRAGVYRYVLTETTDVEKAAAGIEDGTISNVRYLDVYVRDARAGETGRQIYGYVLLSYDNDVDGRATPEKSTVTQAVKTNGFVSSTDADGSTALTADIYKTWNLTVGKTLEGDSYMNTHEFPFTVNFTNAGVTQDVLLKSAATGTAHTVTANTAGAIAATTYQPTIANGGTVKYIGIPKATTATVYETNDVHGTTYASSYVVDSGTASTDKNIMETEVSDTATLVEADTTPVDHAIQYTNVLELISPTGYVARWTPYALILALGFAFAEISKNKKELEA